MGVEDRQDREHRGWRVVGRVQGVGFRWWTRERARQLGLAGWVRNREDGSVEICARGSDEALERLGEILWEGPEGARVETVKEVAGDGGEDKGGRADGGDGFRILRRG